MRPQGPVSGGNEVLASSEPGPQGPAVHSLAGSAILESLQEGSALLLGFSEGCPKLWGEEGSECWEQNGVHQGG